MGPDVELREAASISGPVYHFLRSRRCPKFSGAAPPTGASRACGDPIETTAAGSKFRPRQGFAHRAKRLDGACAPPHLRWGPDVELREAASISGPVYHFLRSRRCPKFSGAAPPTGASRACGDPIETTAAGSKFRPRQGFAHRAKRLDGACAPPHLRWGPDAELREAVSASGPVCHFLRSRRCPKFSGAAPRHGCCSRR